MRKIFLVVMIAVLAVSAVGCASAQFPQNLVEKSAKFEKGKTTYSEVIDQLGNPQGAALLPNGTKSISYTDGYTTGKSTRLELNFDEKDFLVNKMAVKF